VPTGSTTFHEDAAQLTAATRDMHRAIVSLMEELEAIDWYQQRMDATEDPELREILRHNKNEEIEHASMVLEWIRRRSPEFDTQLRATLFTAGSILGAEDALEQPGQPAGRADGDGAPGSTVGSPRTGTWTT
jgi:ferritin-like protein